MLTLYELKLPLDAPPEALRAAAAKRLRCAAGDIASLRLTRKALDSRKKEDIFFIYNVEVQLRSGEEAVLRRHIPKVERTQQRPLPETPLNRKSTYRPVVAGFGPAGMFAALTLARAGLHPLVIERGQAVEQRRADVAAFWQNRRLNPESNVQFGEGGAGTFSDGKLTTGIKDPLCRAVIDELAARGAPEEIRYAAKPHIGTDNLGEVVQNFRQALLAAGGEIRFGCKLNDLILANGAIHGLRWETEGATEDFETDTLLLCIGHSARDTLELLYRRGLPMTRKAFSLGLRIEHPREYIDHAQYGPFAGHPTLGAADYKLACHPPHGRGAYTFCMCPGGTVVNAASEPGMLAVNGMSLYARDAENSNAALLVGIEPEMFPDIHPLAGIALQREVEQRAFQRGGGDYAAPAQLLGDFLAGRPSRNLGSVRPSCPTGVTPGDLRRILPEQVTDTLVQAIAAMDRQLQGFSLPDAVLTAPETRSSSPVRLLRDELYQSAIRGLYPCGEGAGYAGGIVSAAVDGLRCAYAVMKDESDLW